MLGGALELGERRDRLPAGGRQRVVDLEQQGLVALDDERSVGHAVPSVGCGGYPVSTPRGRPGLPERGAAHARRAPAGRRGPCASMLCGRQLIETIVLHRGGAVADPAQVRRTRGQALPRQRSPSGSTRSARERRRRHGEVARGRVRDDERPQRERAGGAGRRETVHLDEVLPGGQRRPGPPSRSTTTSHPRR